MEPFLQIGQIWEDCDPRTPRTMKIISVSNDYVLFQNTQTNRITRVSIQRLKENSRGYRKVKD